LLQAFPKKSLAVLWDFKGLQGFQTSFDAFQIFLLRPPLFGRILDAAGPHSAASRRLAWSASGGPPDFTMQFGRRRIHRGAPIQIERIFNLTDNPISGKKYPQFSRAGSTPASGRSLWTKRAFRFSRTRRPLFRGRIGFITSLFLYQIYM
jgi:hypothetical protein